MELKELKVKRPKSELLTIFLIIYVLYVSRARWGYIAFYGITILMFLRIGLKIQIRSIKKYFGFFLAPRVLILLHAWVCVFIYDQSFYIFRSLNNFLYVSMCVLFAYCLYVLYATRAIQIIFISASSYYLLIMIEAFISVGSTKFLAGILTPGSDILAKWLESHDIGLSFGAILLYYIFYEKHQCKRRAFFIIVSGVIFYLCWKRIAIAAFLACVLFIMIFNKVMDKRNRCIMLWGMVGVMICLAYVFLVKSQILLEWFSANGINTQGRNSLYRFIEQYYEFSPRFWGRGDGYTGKLLTDLARSGNGIGKIVALHSDILRVFVEYGFWGSIVWYAYYLIFLPGRFKKKNRKMYEMLFVLAMYLFIIYLTDNASSYMLCQMLYILLPLQFAVREDRIVADGH